MIVWGSVVALLFEVTPQVAVQLSVVNSVGGWNTSTVLSFVTTSITGILAFIALVLNTGLYVKSKETDRGKFYRTSTRGANQLENYNDDQFNSNLENCYNPEGFQNETSSTKPKNDISDAKKIVQIPAKTSRRKIFSGDFESENSYGESGEVSHSEGGDRVTALPTNEAVSKPAVCFLFEKVSKPQMSFSARSDAKFRHSNICYHRNGILSISWSSKF